jgi:hypothetical protein
MHVSLRTIFVFCGRETLKLDAFVKLVFNFEIWRQSGTHLLLLTSVQI